MLPPEHQDLCGGFRRSSFDDAVFFAVAEASQIHRSTWRVLLKCSNGQLCVSSRWSLDIDRPHTNKRTGSSILYRTKWTAAKRKLDLEWISDGPSVKSKCTIVRNIDAYDFSRVLFHVLCLSVTCVRAIASIQTLTLICAFSQDIKWDPEAHYDCPDGFHHASTAQVWGEGMVEAVKSGPWSTFLSMCTSSVR